MVVTYLLILTGVVGYACWRGYQAEVWLGELSKSVGQLASDITKFDLRQASESRACRTMHDGVEQRLDGLDGEAESIDSRLVAVELQYERYVNSGLPDRMCQVERKQFEIIASLDTLAREFRDERFKTRLDPYEAAAKIGSLDGRLDKLERATKKPRGKK